MPVNVTSAKGPGGGLVAFSSGGGGGGGGGFKPNGFLVTIAS